MMKTRIATAVAVLATAACTAAPAPTTTAPTATTRTTAPPVAEGALQGLLLSPDQIDTAMNTTGMTVDGTYSSMADNSENVSDQACLFLAFPAENPVYAGSGWQRFYQQNLTEPGESAGANYHWANQAAVLFSSAQEAHAFFTASAQRWPACSNRQFTDNGTVWTVGPASNTSGTLSVTKTAPNGGFVRRALTVANNVVIDVLAGSKNPSDAQSVSAVNIAQQIAAKVPTT
jgi:serine/threonine kinase PknH